MTKLSSTDLDSALRSRVSARYFEIVDRLVAAVPELTGAVEDYMAAWVVPDVEPGPINLTDEVLVPSIERWLEDVQTSTPALQRALGFIEELASDDEAEIREVAQIVVNHLSVNPAFDRVTSLVGPRTRELLRISSA